MASNIVSNTIDEEYPVAGQDNDSQGFRDNFSTIKNSLAAAKAEVEDLQDNTSKTNEANNFNGNDQINGNMLTMTEEFINNGTVVSGLNISFENGHYQVITIGADVTLSFADWPDSGRLARMRVEVVGKTGDPTRTVSWSVAGGGTIVTNENVPNPFTIDADEIKIIDVWSYNNGNTVYVDYLGKFS